MITWPILIEPYCHALVHALLDPTYDGAHPFWHFQKYCIALSHSIDAAHSTPNHFYLMNEPHPVEAQPVDSHE